MLSDILLHGFTPAVLTRLAGLLRPGVTGHLDGVHLARCSVRASGRRAFVVKGWVSESRGPAIRFRAKWGRLSGGRVHLQATPQSRWQAAHTTSADLQVDGAQLVLTLGFRDAHGASHTAVFRTV